MWLSPWSIFQTDTFPIKTCQVKGDWWSPWELEFYLLALVFSLLPSLGFLNVDIDTVMNTQYSEERVPNWYILLVKSTCYLTFGIFSDAITRRPLNKLSPSKIDMLVFKDLHRSLSEYCVSCIHPSINVNWGTLSPALYSPLLPAQISSGSHQFVQLAFYSGAKSGPRHNCRPLYYLSRTLWRLENLTKHSLSSSSMTMPYWTW